ncbi:MAG: hypothetical protein K2X60_04600 [Xanthobacteraceae bacterium]|nr:hypothetical protein [Xanthobacteraceae bacterium]
MTRPTLQEIAGIAMLALVATTLFVLPSAGQSPLVKADSLQTLLSAFNIDGIESIPLPSEEKR